MSKSNFGKVVKIIRVERDSTAKEFAEFIGSSPSYIWAIESGRNLVPISYLRKLIEYYSLSTNEINKLLDVISLDYRERVKKKLLKEQEENLAIRK